MDLIKTVLGKSKLQRRLNSLIEAYQNRTKFKASYSRDALAYLADLTKSIENELMDHILHFAAVKGHLEVVKRLLAVKISLDSLRDKDAPLLDILGIENQQLVKLILELQCSMNNYKALRNAEELKQEDSKKSVLDFEGDIVAEFMYLMTPTEEQKKEKAK